MHFNDKHQKGHLGEKWACKQVGWTRHEEDGGGGQGRPCTLMLLLTLSLDFGLWVWLGSGLRLTMALRLGVNRHLLCSLRHGYNFAVHDHHAITSRP